MQEQYHDTDSTSFDDDSSHFKSGVIANHSELVAG